ncbi:MAG TPA: hypothetical protein VE931_06715 [Pyrinomonadaceae bacterium]|nr:hypothetical protein [Pyrinomonadaceae bacterium]
MTYRPFATVLVIALCVWSVQAQSGRKHAKPAPATPVATPTPEPTPAPKKADKVSELLFYVGADRSDSYAMLSYAYYDWVVRGCADRLRAGSSAGVEVTDQSFTRGEAIKKAKSETKSNTVLLNLKYDNMARTDTELILEYIVFAPGTAKIVTQGHSYLNANRAGPVIVGPSSSRIPSSELYREQLLRRAGEDAGDRILKALHLDVDIPRQP